MSLASDKLVSANGWQEFDVVDNTKDKNNQAHLDFAHSVASTFKTTQGKEVLNAMIQRYLLVDIVSAGDTQFAAGIKQGRASVIKSILSQIEISDNSK